MGDRPLRVARELTKRHEEQVGPTVSAALEHFRRQPPQGECTLVLGGAPEPEPPSWDATGLRAELQALVAAGLGSKEAARQLAERLRDARVEVLGRCGHWPMLERPIESQRALRAFLERQR